jgi:hypothetical protein
MSRAVRMASIHLGALNISVSHGAFNNILVYFIVNVLHAERDIIPHFAIFVFLNFWSNRGPRGLAVKYSLIPQSEMQVQLYGCSRPIDQFLQLGTHFFANNVSIECLCFRNSASVYHFCASSCVPTAKI